MKRIDRLLIKVRQASGQTDDQVSLGFVEREFQGEYKGMWKATTTMWNENNPVISYHQTEEEAVRAIEALEEIYNTSKQLCKKKSMDVPIIIDDVPESNEIIENNSQREA